MVKKVLLVFTILLASLSTNLYAQQNPNSIEVAPFYGVQMFSVLPNILKGNFFGGEVVYHLNMGNNQADWVKAMGLKDISFAASYRNFESVYLVDQPNTTGILGQTFGITSRLSLPLFYWDKTEVLFTPGFGFAYTTQSYYTDNNPLIGSHINFTAQVGIKAMRRLSATSRLFVGFDIYHYSNAAVKLPNDGVNSLNASVGIDQDLSTDGPGTSRHVFARDDRNSLEFGVDIGKRGLIQSGDGLNLEQQKMATSHLYQSGIYAGYNYYVSKLFSLKAGVDGIYYYTPFDINNFYATFQERGSSYDHLSVGTSLGFDIWLGRVAFEANYGYYVHFASYYGDQFYWTFGGQYFVTPWMAIEVKQYLRGTEAGFAGFGVLFRGFLSKR